MFDLIDRLRRFATLPPAERRLWLRALGVLWFFRAALWILPFRRVRRWAEPHPLESNVGVSPQTLAEALRSASRYVPRATCLVNALAGARLFAEQGYPAQVVLGARMVGGKLEAHAWLECGGQVAVGKVKDLATYRPLKSPKSGLGRFT